MKRIVLTIIAGLFAASTFAGVQCGPTPPAPPGCKYLCMCDNNGYNCRFVLVC
jgi:hypothetical protein